MNVPTDEIDLLPSVLKLVNGDKKRCFQLIKEIRGQYPAKSMQWCLQKVIYDLRHSKKVPPPPPPPNPGLSAPKLQHWGVTGVVLNSKEQEKPLAVSSRDLQALIETKRRMPSQQASEASRRRLYKLLSGDVEQARRLVQRVRIANADKSEQWAVEKVIYDLERDRR